MLFHEAISDPGSFQLSTLPFPEYSCHLHGTRWLPKLQLSHIHSRRKEARTFFLVFNEDWEIIPGIPIHGPKLRGLFLRK